MITLKDFFNMTKLIYGMSVHIYIYPNAKSQDHDNLCYSNEGDQYYHPDVLNKYGDCEIGFIEPHFQTIENIVSFNVYLF